MKKNIDTCIQEMLEFIELMLHGPGGIRHIIEDRFKYIYDSEENRNVLFVCLRDERILKITVEEAKKTEREW